MPDNNSATPANVNNVAIRKRQQIENASKSMFLWVALAAAVLGVAAVLSVSLFERIAFNQKVLNKKNETVGILRDNNEVVDELKSNVRVLNTSEVLGSTPRLENTEPLSVILDALPSAANSSALGASLQQKLLQEDGITIESLVVTPIAGVEDDNSAEGEVVSDSTQSLGENEIAFEFTISTPLGNGEDRLKKVLRNLERSIRVINLTTATIERQGSRLSLTAEGKSYYQPEVRVELKEEDVKP